MSFSLNLAWYVHFIKFMPRNLNIEKKKKYFNIRETLICKIVMEKALLFT